MDLVWLQRRETRCRIERHERHLEGIVEDGGCHRAAEIDVEAGPCTLFVDARKARQTLTDAAIERAALLDSLQGLGTGGTDRHKGYNQQGDDPEYAEQLLEIRHLFLTISCALLRPFLREERQANIVRNRGNSQ